MAIHRPWNDDQWRDKAERLGLRLSTQLRPGWPQKDNWEFRLRPGLSSRLPSNLFCLPVVSLPPSRSRSSITGLLRLLIFHLYIWNMLWYFLDPSFYFCSWDFLILDQELRNNCQVFFGNTKSFLETKGHFRAGYFLVAIIFMENLVCWYSVWILTYLEFVEDLYERQIIVAVS